MNFEEQSTTLTTCDTCRYVMEQAGTATALDAYEVLRRTQANLHERIAALEAERDRLNHWVLRLITPPRAGWYYVHNLDGSLSSRYYDDSDGVWWNSTARDGWTPNNSFIDWLWVDEVHGDITIPTDRWPIVNADVLTEGGAP